ncbi:MAG TPA: alpha/beta fold hydrolase [Chitinophagaceae bacterium]|nr:alpha/beta fold hydrolase [Chitinophagaceae bacterium]
MQRPLYCAGLLMIAVQITAQPPANSLTVEKIMRDPKWIGSSPSNVQWSADGQYLYFSWNPDKNIADSVYYITATNKTPVKADPVMTQQLTGMGSIVYNQAYSAYVFTRENDIFYRDLKSGKTRRITQTMDNESNPRFSFQDTRVVYTRNQNLFAWDIISGETVQLTNIRTAETPAAGTRSGTAIASRTSTANQQEEWLKNDQLRYFDVLRTRKEKREKTEAYNKTIPKTNVLRSINLDDKTLGGLGISPDGRFINYSLTRPASNAKTTIVPSFVTESGFTTDINSRTKVGAPQGVAEYFIYDRDRDTIYVLKTDSIPGIKELPAYWKDYPKQWEEKNKKPSNRAVSISGVSWSPGGKFMVMDIRSLDNKDRWLMHWDTAARILKLIDRQRDEAWIAGPGIGFFGRTGWLNENLFWFQSEASGYSHLYTVNLPTGEKRALTSGNFEVQQAQLSRDKKYFYISTNEVHPGEQHFYRLSLNDGKKEKLTTMKGANQVVLSRDEKWLAILYSYTNKPWELYWMENKPGGKLEQITNKAQTDEFRAYAWRDPELVSFRAADGALVYARLYKPASPHPNKPAVLFVHGAGYLQNAHKWWSSYFREFMFNNLLADQGYYVMDIDYRGSAGYGRDWRTGIYRHMGGKDLSDHVDGVKWMVQQYGINPKNVGLYGGSYGGFIALMGMFTEPSVFAAGAALRPVTDWAQYNHGYTSNILNEPYNDSLAYRRSSPFYFAEGLKGHLLMCHGMVDVNVHFQDAVKLSQRLIELGKDNWELAVYPMEDHGFVEPSSWTDEYKRILKLFETVLKK